MSTPRSDGRTEDFLRETGRSAFGAARLAANRRTSDAENAMLEAAERLLTKAGDRLAAGDDDRAATLVRRALALPVEPRWLPPAPMAMHLSVFDTALGAWETADEGDDRWLDLALDARAAARPETAEREFGAALDALGDQGLPDRLLDRIHEVVPAGASLPDPMIAIDDEAERVDTVLGVLRALQAYRRALAA